MYIKNTVYCTTRPDLHVGELECLWLELRIRNKKSLYRTYYIQPNSDQQTWESFEQSIKLAINSNHDVIITGDFNINHLNNNPNDKIGTLLTQ